MEFLCPSFSRKEILMAFSILFLAFWDETLISLWIRKKHNKVLSIIVKKTLTSSQQIKPKKRSNNKTEKKNKNEKRNKKNNNKKLHRKNKNKSQKNNKQNKLRKLKKLTKRNSKKKKVRRNKRKIIHQHLLGMVAKLKNIFGHKH